MKINRTIQQRIIAIALFAVSVGLFFQNCGQPGKISVTSPSTQALSENNGTNTGVAIPVVPDPITLIANPKVSINNDELYTNKKDVTLQLSAIGAQEMLISNESNCATQDAWQPYSQTKAWVLAHENQDVGVYAKFRKVGAPETECVKASILHDSQVPEVGIDAYEKYTAQKDVQITYSAQDNKGSGIDKVYCQFENQAETICADVLSFQNLVDEKSYTFSIRAVDKSGNKSAKLSESFVVDRTAPVVTINGPKGSVGDKNLSFKILAVDANPLKAIVCRLSPVETNYKDCSGLIANYNNLESGAYKFEVSASDMAGNVGQAEQSIEIDLSVPTVMITKGPDLIGNKKNVSFEFSGMSGKKALSKFMCSLNGSSETSCASPAPIENLVDKEYVFSVYGINDVNVKSAAQSYKFIIDTLAPTIRISSMVPAAVIKNPDVSLTLEANDLNGLASVICYLNNVAKDCSTLAVQYAGLPDGSYSFFARATDKAGNSSVTSTISWVVDTTPDSKILASFAQNPVAEGATAQLNVALTQVTQASYKCTKVSDGSSVQQGAIAQNNFSTSFVLTESTTCLVSGKDKVGAEIKVSVVAEINCGNRINQNGKCVDFKCASVVSIPFSASFTVPERTSAGVCYAMKIFDRIALGSSKLTTRHDTDVVSRNHDSGGTATINPYVLNNTMLNFKLSGPRVAKLSGGLDAVSPIKVDNFVLVGLYPKAISPLISHYSAHGTADSTLSTSMNYILFNKEQLAVKSFGPGGTATVTPLQIVNEADTNLDYVLDLRALDCGGSRELSDIYLLFQ